MKFEEELGKQTTNWWKGQTQKRTGLKLSFVYI